MVGSLADPLDAATGAAVGGVVGSMVAAVAGARAGENEYVVRHDDPQR